MLNYKEHKEWSEIAKNDPDRAIKFMIEKSQEYPKMENKFEAALICNLLIEIYNNLPDEYENKVYELMPKIAKDLEDFSSLVVEKEIWELTTNKLWKNNGVVSGEYENTKLREWIPYAFAHNANLSLIQNLLKKCKKDLYKLKEIRLKINEILNKENKNDDGVWIYGFKEVTCIAAMLRKCIEIVIWWGFKYNRQNINKKFYKYMTYEVFQYYINNNLLNFNIETIDMELSDFDHYKYALFSARLWETETLKMNYKNLSKFIHYDITKDAELLSIYDIDDLNQIWWQRKNNLDNAYEYFNDLIEIISDSLTNHLVRFEGDKCIAIVRNFKIDYKDIHIGKLVLSNDPRNK